MPFSCLNFVKCSSHRIYSLFPFPFLTPFNTLLTKVSSLVFHLRKFLLSYFPEQHSLFGKLMLEQPSVLSKAKLAGRWGGVGGVGREKRQKTGSSYASCPVAAWLGLAGTPLVLRNSLCILYFWRFFFSCSISKYMLRESPAVISLSHFLL